MTGISIRRLGVISLLLFLSLACGLFAPDPAPVTPPPDTSSPLDKQRIHDTAATEEALYVVEIPTAAPVVEDADGISIEYVYTDGLITALYHLYGTVLDNFVDISLTNDGQETVTLVIETSIEGFTTTSSDTVYIDPGETVEIHHNPRLYAEAVNRLNSEQPGNFHIRVLQIDPGEDQLLLDESRQILLYSRRDFVWVDGFDYNEEYKLWAAWVTPTDPAVESLIRSAAEYTGGGIMTSGYGGQVDDEDGSVWERLEAIWEAEQDVYHLTYISTMVAFGPNTVQRMRLPAEVLDQSSGNCIELAALFASAAEALGLETAIIRIPGHAYTAVRIDEVNANYYFIETTMVGQNSFSDAVDVGEANWNEAFPHFEAGEEGFAWVTIQDARLEGILPIPWR